MNHTLWTDTWWTEVAGASLHLGVPADLRRWMGLDGDGPHRVRLAGFWGGPRGSGGDSGRSIARLEDRMVDVRRHRISAKGVIPGSRGQRQEVLARLVLPGGRRAPQPRPVGPVIVTTFESQFQRVRCPVRFFHLEEEDRWFARWTYAMERTEEFRSDYCGLGAIREVRDRSGVHYVLDWADLHAWAPVEGWLDGGNGPMDSVAHVGVSGLDLITLEGGRPRFRGGDWGDAQPLRWVPGSTIDLGIPPDQRAWIAEGIRRAMAQEGP
ncbi:MAG: hypothetical protein JXX28_11815 [Deltaproteobacteria bacterium]|nr:hypothetical protein [Deltaproteobacteria bacterium]